MVEKKDRIFINDLADGHFHVPDLLSIQLDSYNEFIQGDKYPHERERRGLQEIFLEIFPIRDFTENIILEFIDYNLGFPPQTVGEQTILLIRIFVFATKVVAQTKRNLNFIPLEIKFIMSAFHLKIVRSEI